MRRWWWCAAYTLVCACGGPSASDAGADDAALAGPVAPIFEPAVLEGGRAFFDFPFPSELRTDAEGRADLSSFPNNRGLVAEGIDVLATETPGVSPITGVYLRFSGPLDAASLPAAPADAGAADSPVLLIDVDADSPERGRQMPAYVRFQEEDTRFWAANTLVVRAVPGVHLHPGRRYAVVVRDGVLARGAPVEHAAAFEALKSGAGSPLAESYGALFDELETHGVMRGPILSATAFRVRDAATEMDLARAFVHTQPLPTVSRWSALSASPRVLSLEAEYETYSLMGGTPPFTEFGSGNIRFDADGAPLSVRRERVRVGLIVPNGVEAPPGGHPIVLYAHGTGGDHRTHLGDEGATLVESGIAMLGFEAALHGGRNQGGGLDPETLIAVNPIAARDMARQTVIDAMLMLRMLAEGAFDIPAEVSGTEPITFARAPVLFMGHSQGSQEGGILLGVEPTIDAAFLSAGGAGGLISILERDLTTGQPLSCLVAGAINESCTVLTEDHPVLTLIVQPLLDPADPVSFTHRFLRERPADWAPLSLAMTEGDEDVYTPPRAIEAMAAGAGLPIVAPLVQASDPFTLLGTPTVSAPVSGNLTLASGDAVTGGLMQWAGQGHFAIYALPDARNRYKRFFETAVSGAPTLVAPL